MQFFLYLIVGGLSFIVEIATFIGLRQMAAPVIAASVLSFIVATIANYLLSVALAFQGGRFRRHVELTRFLSVVLVGLVLNTALVWCFVYPLAIPPIVAKIAVVPIVLMWNYIGRRLFVFSDQVPFSIARRFGRERQSQSDIAGAYCSGLQTTNVDVSQKLPN